MCISGSGLRMSISWFKWLKLFVPDIAGFGQQNRSLYIPWYYFLHRYFFIVHHRPSLDAFSSPKKPGRLGRLPAHPASYSVGAGGPFCRGGDWTWQMTFNRAGFNPLNGKLNPIFHLLALLGAYYTFHVSGIRVNLHCITSQKVKIPFTARRKPEIFLQIGIYL